MCTLCIIARRHGHVFRMPLHNEGSWRMETWQRARRARCHVSIRQSPSCVMPFWTHAKCLLAFISYRPMWIKPNTHLLKPFIARDFMEGHICRQNTLMFALVFCFELRERAVRTCRHCHLAVKNPIHDGNQGQLKLPKSHEWYRNVVTWHWIVYKWRRIKQRLSFLAHFSLYSSSRCRCHAGTDILRLRGHTL